MGGLLSSPKFAVVPARLRRYSAGIVGDMNHWSETADIPTTPEKVWNLLRAAE